MFLPRFPSFPPAGGCWGSILSRRLKRLDSICFCSSQTWREAEEEAAEKGQFSSLRMLEKSLCVNVYICTSKEM